MLTTIASYRLVSQDLNRSLEQKANEPLIKRETEYYLENIVNVKSIDEFLDNDRLFNYAMKAHGLEDMSYAKAFMRKALVEGIDERDTFANNLADTRYRDFVEAFNFARHGKIATVFTSAQTGTSEKYIRQTLEEDVGEENTGVRLALYFQRKAPTVTSAFGLMGDKALLEVTQTALNLPPSMSNLDIDRQAEIISEKIDIEDFKDPEKLDAFLQRFAALWELNNPTSAASSSAVPNVLLSGTGIIGINDSILASLQNLKIGG